MEQWQNDYIPDRVVPNPVAVIDLAEVYTIEESEAEDSTSLNMMRFLLCFLYSSQSAKHTGHAPVFSCQNKPL